MIPKKAKKPSIKDIFCWVEIMTKVSNAYDLPDTELAGSAHKVAVFDLEDFKALKVALKAKGLL